MAQPEQKDSKQNDSSLTIDTNGTQGFQFSYTWPVRTPEIINAFVYCDPDTKLASKMITNSFKLNNEDIVLNWYIYAYPNGYTPTWENTSDLFILSILIPHLPISKTLRIKSLRMRHLVSIPQLHILESRPNNFD